MKNRRRLLTAATPLCIVTAAAFAIANPAGASSRFAQSVAGFFGIPDATITTIYVGAGT